MYEDTTLQSYFHSDQKPWWVKEEPKRIVPGRLLWAFLPHTDLIPNVLIPVGRASDTEHKVANYRIEDFSTANPPKKSRLPVAALPDYEGERRFVYRAKRRPAVVISTGGTDIPKILRPGTKPKWQTAPTMIIAPYYGAEENDLRAGWHGKLVERIQQCEYPQYMWERLPINHPPRESILKFDHIQPLGRHYKSFEITDYVLCKHAVEVLNDWLIWLTRGMIPEDSFLYEIREELLKQGK